MSLYASLSGQYEVYMFPLHIDDYGGDDLTVNDVEIPPQIVGEADFEIDVSKSVKFWKHYKEKNPDVRLMGLAHSHGSIGSKRHSSRDERTVRKLMDVAGTYNRVSKTSRRSRTSKGNLETVLLEEGEEKCSLSFGQVRDKLKRYFAVEELSDIKPVRLPPFPSKEREEKGLALSLKKAMDDRNWSSGRKNKVLSRLIEQAMRYKDIHQILNRNGISSESLREMVDERIDKFATEAYKVDRELYSFIYSIVVNRNTFNGWVSPSEGSVAYVQARKEGKDSEFLYEKSESKEVPLELVSVSEDVNFDVGKMKSKWKARVKLKGKVNKGGFSGR